MTFGPEAPDDWFCPECHFWVEPQQQVMSKDGRPDLTILYCPNCETVLNAQYALDTLEADIEDAMNNPFLQRRFPPEEP